MTQLMPVPLPQPARKCVRCEISEAVSKSLSGTLPLGFSLSVRVDVASHTSGPVATLAIVLNKPTIILTERERLTVLQLVNTLQGSIELGVKVVLMPEKSPPPSSLAGDFQER